MGLAHVETLIQEANSSALAWDARYEQGRAVQVFGSEEAAAKWMGKEAVGLPSRQRPIDLLDSPDGIEMVVLSGSD